MKKKILIQIGIDTALLIIGTLAMMAICKLTGSDMVPLKTWVIIMISAVVIPFAILFVIYSSRK